MIFLETASSTNIWYDIALVGIGILATLIGGIIMKLLDNKFAKYGELAIYYRVINIQHNVITLRIQIKNASHEVKFLRDICLFSIKTNQEKNYWLRIRLPIRVKMKFKK